MPEQSKEETGKKNENHSSFYAKSPDGLADGEGALCELPSDNAEGVQASSLTDPSTMKFSDLQNVHSSIHVKSFVTNPQGCQDLHGQTEQEDRAGVREDSQIL